jgi:preprotein translocase subunit SecE
MGRLLKKKEPGLKKKHKIDESLSAESDSESTGVSISNQSTAAISNQQKNTPVKKTFASGLLPKVKIKYIDEALQFLREVKIELKKVAWPSRKQATGSTIVVIILVMLVSFFLGIVDIGLSSLIKAVLS